MSVETDRPEPSDVERIKLASRHLRGTLEDSLADPLTGAIAADDTQVSKFHGIYQQDDRDLRTERQRQRLEPAYEFMIRARIPAGLLTPAQWIAFDDIAGRYANGTLRATTRQAIQFHGVIKRELKATMQAINASLVDTLAACGDVNRNVMSAARGDERNLIDELDGYAAALSDHLAPRTRAYHEIWLDGERARSPDVEPIYGERYLPRKFKLALALPPHNDVDIYSQDLGFIAVVEQGRIAGFNLAVGGGMGMAHGDRETYPRLASVIGRCAPDALNAVAEAVVTTQRDFGDRSNRRHARLKYTIDDRGVDWFRSEVERRSGIALAPPAEVLFTTSGDRSGWYRDDRGEWQLNVFCENGRIADRGERRLRTFFRRVAESGKGRIRLTPNQNVTIENLDDSDVAAIRSLARDLGVADESAVSPLRAASLACVGFPTCGLAMAESERYLPSLIDRLDELCARHGIQDVPIVTRMTGCPNGCARPYLAEIGLVGKGPGRYNLYLGAAHNGTRLNRLYRENVNEEDIVEALDPLFIAFAAGRRADEPFGDFLVRAGHIDRAGEGQAFHDDAA